MTKKHDDKEMQKRYVQLQLLKQYATAMIEEKGNLESRISEIAVTIHAVEKLNEVKKGQEMLASLGAEVYINSSIEDAGSMVIGLGSGIYAKKTIKEAEEILGNRRKELEEAHQNIMEEVTQLVEQIEILENQMQGHVASARNETD